jgi:predicted secreted protein
MNFLGEKVLKETNGNKVPCEVVGNGYWKIYVAKNRNMVIRADYYREYGKTKDVITSLTNFKYSKVEIGENEVMDFPVTFRTIIPSTNYSWDCSISKLRVNEQTSFDDSLFKFRN